jgi:hypothetical protein
VSSRRFLTFGTVLLLLLVGSRVSAAQPNPTITVNPTVAGPLTISTAVAGQEPTGVAAGGGTYTLVLKKNRGIGTITARLSAPLPAGTTLSITLANPGGGATSVGAVQLNTSPQTVVVNLPNQNTTLSNKAITYSFTATSAAGVLALQSVIVNLDLAP